MRFTTLIAAVGVLACSVTFAKEDLSTWQREKILGTGQAFISAIQFPSPEEAVGFKSLKIGGEFNLDHPAVNAYVSEDDNAGRNFDPYTCQFLDPFPVFMCRLSLWNTDSVDRGGYTQDLLELESAFGSKVKVNFSVLMNQAPTMATLRARSFGKGRILGITVSSAEVSGDFQRAAKEYFTNKYGVEPLMKSEYKNPSDVYSAECMALLGRVGNKPESQVTVREREQLAACENAAMIAALSGKATGKSSIINTWDLGEYTVTLSTLTTNTYGKVDKKSDVKIQVKLEKADAARLAEISRVNAEIKEKTEKNNMHDF